MNIFIEITTVNNYYTIHKYNSMAMIGEASIITKLIYYKHTDNLLTWHKYDSQFCIGDLQTKLIKALESVGWKYKSQLVSML